MSSASKTCPAMNIAGRARYQSHFEAEGPARSWPHFNGLRRHAITGLRSVSNSPRRPCHRSACSAALSIPEAASIKRALEKVWRLIAPGRKEFARGGPQQGGGSQNSTKSSTRRRVDVTFALATGVTVGWPCIGLNMYPHVYCVYACCKL